MAENVIISDSSPVINLLKVNHLSLLQKMYGKVIIPKAVFDEINKPEFLSQAEIVKNASYIEIKKINEEDEEKVEWLMTENSPRLHRGESEVLILANELKADLLIIDEQNARAFASSQYQVVGVVGIVKRSFERNFIDEDEAYQIAEIWKVKDKTGIGQLLENVLNAQLSLEKNRGLQP